MWKKKRFTCLGLFLIFLASFIPAGYAQELESMKFSTGAFINVNRLDTDLQRGVSTKMDVQRVLGAPKGMGGAIVPVYRLHREFWYYEDIEMKDIKKVEGVYKANMRQQVLFITFDKGVYDGYMWFTNVSEEKAK
jgi:hypothetical protein